MIALNEAASRIRLGQIVRVLSGREAGMYAVIVRLDEKAVWLANGKKRRFDQPKRKNIRHIQPTKFIAKDVVHALEQTGQVEDAKLVFALNQYLLGKGE